MPQVAILKTTQAAVYDRDGYVDHWATTAINKADFEEISDEELKEAKSCIQYMSGKNNNTGYILVEKTTFEEVRPLFKQIIAEIKAIKDKQEADRNKRLAIERKRQEKREASIIERKKKQLEKLKKELECQ